MHTGLHRHRPSYCCRRSLARVYDTIAVGEPAGGSARIRHGIAVRVAIIARFTVVEYAVAAPEVASAGVVSVAGSLVSVLSVGEAVSWLSRGSSSMRSMPQLGAGA